MDACQRVTTGQAVSMATVSIMHSLHGCGHVCLLPLANVRVCDLKQLNPQEALAQHQTTERI